MTTLNAWRSDAATALISVLPLQTFATAQVAVEAYLNSVGGWIPENASAPTGEGEPANGLSPVEGAQALADERLARTQVLTGTVNVDLDITFLGNFADGQTEADILSQMQPLIQELLEENLSKVPVAVNQVSTPTGTVTAGGSPTASERVSINAAVEADIFSDPRAVALHTAVDTFLLEGNWNVHSVFTETDRSHMIVIRKYTSSDFVSLDTTETEQYVVSVNPRTYKSESCVRRKT